MRKTPSVPVDRSSQTYNDASAIIGSGKSSAIPPPPATREVHSIDVEPAANGGVTVSHRMKNPPPTGKGKGEYFDPSGPRETNVFSTPNEAHAHIGHLLGIGGGGKGAGGLT